MLYFWQIILSVAMFSCSPFADKSSTHGQQPVDRPWGKRG